MIDYSGIQIRDDSNDNIIKVGECRVCSEYESKMIRKSIFMKIILYTELATSRASRAASRS